MPGFSSRPRHDSSMAPPAVRRAGLPDLSDLLALMEDFNHGEHIPWDRSRFEQSLVRRLGDDDLGRVGIAAAGDAVVTWGYDLESATA